MYAQLPCSDPVCRTVAGVPSSLLPLQLRVVVQPAGAPLGDDAFTVAFHPDLIGAVVVKGRQDEALVLTRHLAATWQVPAARLWEDALRALSVEPLDVRQFTLPASRTEAYSVTGMGWPGAAHMFRLEPVLSRRLPLGALVMLMDGNSFVALPLESNATLHAASALWDLNETLGRHALEPLPPRLLWVRGWTVRDLNAAVVDGTFTATLPRELGAPLAELN
ncbi:hypothetical protein KGQ20_18505 [Catenulispora sp. NF23]|uniref:Uncharacterized protein n=1 Tax=Catenulispora pinistramenti TaxID=2705254 RepID=A0ABS5KZ72_9ACTN|nr:hypothetical protein [Catenulispora pinistramenti]MBS2534765.1 hypothetical protein [Catenulispora pinistramenti]MBS2551376.1 hypothetical protein [Catenulispora pinistramenti]